MAVDWQRPEYQEALPEWSLVDICADERGLDELLPKLNPLDLSAENTSRNEEYRKRASWFGATSFTLAGLIGTAFGDAPAIELPGALEYLRGNCDGEGTDLQQQMQATAGQVLRKGRGGLFVTYPQVEGGASRADQAAGKAVATVHMIDAKRIINWWTVADGAEVKIGGVVFSDTVQEVDDFEVKETEVYREISLIDGAAYDRTWMQFKESNGQSGWRVIKGGDGPILMGDGSPWREVPFVFVGALDNTTKLDRPPLLALARLNCAHYRNSADYEESAFYCGQPVPWVSGWHQDDVNTAKQAGAYIGSRQLIVADNFAFAQASPNIIAGEAMEKKQAQMKALGARFLEPGTVAKTATEASGEMRVQHSILSLAMANVEDAYNRALSFAGTYMRVDGEILVAVTREYMRGAIADERVSRFIELWDRALVGPSEAHRVLTSANIVDPDLPVTDYVEQLGERGVTQGEQIADA